MMEKFNSVYSIKNISIPPERKYKLQLMDKIECLIKKMRWKAIYFTSDNEIVESEYGLRRYNCPKPVKELINF